MNRSSIVVQNGNIPVIPSAPSAWNLTPPDTCSFVWAGILQQDSSLAPSLSSHLPSLSASFLNVLTLARLLSFYLLLSFICLRLDTILFTFLPSTHSNIPAFTNTPKLLFQTTSFHFFISLKYSFHPHDTLCLYSLHLLFGHIFIQKIFTRKTFHRILKLCSRDFILVTMGGLAQLSADVGRSDFGLHVAFQFISVEPGLLGDEVWTLPRIVLLFPTKMMDLRFYKNWKNPLDLPTFYLVSSFMETKGPILKHRYVIVPDIWPFSPHPSTFSNVLRLSLSFDSQDESENSSGTQLVHSCCVCYFPCKLS